ncbi:hypothetical protein [Massilia sp. TSP1-1-2]|uniref:hypothetical protein n=1 Tax=unclassified Massilia TaxID=2609279 RepID=UPI003CEAD15C
MATSQPCACTHLNVSQKKMVFLSSFTIPNDNTGGHKFYYDRQFSAPFSVPKGWSFVVTDITVAASPVSGPLPDPKRYILAIVAFTNGEERHFEASLLTDNTMHTPLSGAYVIPSGHTPTFRNTTFSTSHAEAKLIGYFVPGDGLGPGEPAFPGAAAAATDVEGQAPLARKAPIG